MKMPNVDDLRFAAEWMRQYDDSHDGGKQSATAQSVAEWLDQQANQKQTRDLARDKGVPVGKLRNKLIAMRKFKE